MKKNIIIWAALLVLGVDVYAHESTVSTPKEGVLDLRESTLDNQSLFSLNGEWLFHWERLLTPGIDQGIMESGIVVEVPSYWNSYLVNGESLPEMGYGTYSLRILLPKGYRSALCFDIPVFDVAFKFYLNNRLVQASGEVGTTREEEKPWYEPSSFCYTPDTDTLQLLIQVSNFHHRRGGFWATLYTGGTSKLLERMERRRMYNYSTIGVLFFFTIFFLIFWFISRKESLMWIFAMATLGILIRSVNTGLYFSNSFVYTPWEWQVRMEYFGTYLAHIFGMIFLHKIFPIPYMKWVIRVNTIIFSLACISLFILPVRLFTYEMLVFQPTLLLFLIFYMIISLIGVVKRKIVDSVFFVSMALFTYTLLNDILLANSAGAAYSNYLSQISFQLFVLAMSVLIIMQWVRNYNTRLELEASLRFKNKVLSIVAHDLKNPIASVAQFSDLLTTKPELSSNKNIINSLRESSQAAVTMLDNLLYWGRSQADELFILPERFRMKKLVERVESLYRHMAMQKELQFTAEVDPDIEAYADEALINIVLRNLVSNAIKFTPRKGSVHIHVKQEYDAINCSVIDNGIGIQPEVLQQFNTEGHLETTSGTDQEQGTGLGLQLVRDLVAQTGGILKIESNPEAGSTFTFTIPLYKE